MATKDPGITASVPGIPLQELELRMRRRKTGGRTMNMSCHNDVFFVPIAVFDQLDPIEKIVIRDQERRGLVKIIEPSSEKGAQP